MRFLKSFKRCVRSSTLKYIINKVKNEKPLTSSMLLRSYQGYLIEVGQKSLKPQSLTVDLWLYFVTSCVLVVNGWNYVSFHSLCTHNPLIQYYKMKYKKMCLGTQILKLRERLVQQGWIRGQWFDLYWACAWQTLDFKRALLKVMGHLLH